MKRNSSMCLGNGATLPRERWKQTTTRILQFFSIKRKTYQGFPDGDEVRFPRDLKLTSMRMGGAEGALQGDILYTSVFAATSVGKWNNSLSLNGVCEVWCAGGGHLEFLQGRPKMLSNRGRCDLVLRRSQRDG